MKKLILTEVFGFVQLYVLIGMLLLAVSLPLATRLVQQNQENRSSAASTTTYACSNSETKCIGTGLYVCNASRTGWSLKTAGASECSGSTTKNCSGLSMSVCEKTSGCAWSDSGTCVSAGNSLNSSSCTKSYCSSGVYYTCASGKITATTPCLYGCYDTTRCQTKAESTTANVNCSKLAVGDCYNVDGCEWDPYNEECITADNNDGLTELSNEYRQKGESCNYTSQCQEPLICSGKKCVEETIKRTGNKNLNSGCSSDGDCVSPYICYKNDGVCKVRSGGECEGSSDCYSNHYCSDYNNHCRKIDSTWLGDTSVEGETVYSLIHGGSTTQISQTSKITRTPTPTPTNPQPTTSTQTSQTSKLTPTPTTPKTTTSTQTSQTSKPTPTPTNPQPIISTQISQTSKITRTPTKKVSVDSGEDEGLSSDIILVLTMTPTPTPILYFDVNGDGTFNLIDISLVKSKLGTSVDSGDRADLVEDGFINFFDWDAILKGFLGSGLVQL